LRSFFLFNNWGNEVSSLDETSVFGMIFTLGSNFVFFQKALDGFSSERSVNLKLFGDDRGSDIDFFGDNVFE
jgi:hypothetical protein